MVMDTVVKNGMYLYAIVPSSEAPVRHPHGFDGTLGVNGSAVTWICEGPLAAAVNFARQSWNRFASSSSS